MEYYSGTMLGWYIGVDQLLSLADNNVLNLVDGIKPQPFDYDHQAIVEYLQKILDHFDGEVVVAAHQDWEGNVVGYVIGDVIYNKEFEYIVECRNHLINLNEITELFKLTDPTTVINYTTVC